MYHEPGKSRPGSRNGRTHTIAVIFTPAIAAAIRRTGNRTGSISKVIHSLIDPAKLAELIAADEAHQRRCDS